MNKLIGKLICIIKGEHQILVGTEEETRQWLDMIDAAVKTNGFALLRCSRCGEVVTRVTDEEETNG